MRAYLVYKHIAPNGKVYIGITSRKPEYRWNNGKGYQQNKHFTAAINKYGWDSFAHIIVAEGLSKENAATMEKQLIQEYRANNPEFGYNNSTGGEFPAQGAKLSEETRARQSAAHKGKKLPPTHGQHVSAAKKGKPNGNEGKIGRLNAKAGRVFMIEEETGKIVKVFYGYNDMARETGFARTPVKEAVSGKRKRAYGYLWAYQRRLNNVTI